MNILEEIAEKTKERIREEKMQVSISNLLSQIEERKKTMYRYLHFGKHCKTTVCLISVR